MPLKPQPSARDKHNAFVADQITHKKGDNKWVPWTDKRYTNMHCGGYQYKMLTQNVRRNADGFQDVMSGFSARVPRDLYNTNSAFLDCSHEDFRPFADWLRYGCLLTNTITPFSLVLFELHKFREPLALLKQRMVANIGIGNSCPKTKGEFVEKFNKDHVNFSTATAHGFFRYLVTPNPLASFHSVNLQYAIPDPSFKYHRYEMILPESQASGVPTVATSLPCALIRLGLRGYELLPNCDVPTPHSSLIFQRRVIPCFFDSRNDFIKEGAPASPFHHVPFEYAVYNCSSADSIALNQHTPLHAAPGTAFLPPRYDPNKSNDYHALTSYTTVIGKDVLFNFGFIHKNEVLSTFLSEAVSKFAQQLSGNRVNVRFEVFLKPEFDQIISATHPK